MFSIHSALVETPLSSLRPTQITVGFAEVEKKRKEWASLSKRERKARMREQLFPAVKGPTGHYYILDHHHTAMALDKEASDYVQVGTVKDLSSLTETAFWIYLDHFSWLHAYDARGRRQPFTGIPQRLADLKDDPFRSLAAEVRDAGGFSKPVEPFQEYLWANFFRELFRAKQLRAKQKKIVEKAVEIARSSAAKHLPGWSGSR